MQCIVLDSFDLQVFRVCGAHAWPTLKGQRDPLGYSPLGQQPHLAQCCESLE